MSVLADSVRLQQVFWNLLKNAVKFTPERGLIDVRVSVEPGEPDEFSVFISDTGIGLTAAEIIRVFQPFVQGDHAAGGAHRFGGLGLGLAISHEIVRLHGGTLRASSPGRDCGATFHLRLPLLIPDAPPSVTERSAPRESDTAARVNGGNLRILLVEDHGPTRQTLVTLLGRRGHEVASASSGAEAREHAARGHYDLVVSDIGLPDITGFELMSELRERHGLTGIALTGYGSDKDVDQGQAAGFVEHLTKPVRIGALDEALARFLARRSLRNSSDGLPARS